MNAKKPEPTVASPYHTQSFSLKGLRPQQQDNCLIAHGPDRCLVLVADGLGGHAQGDYASKACTEIFEARFDQLTDPSDPGKFLRETALHVNAQLLRKGEEDRTYLHCGTTLTGFLVMASQFYLINIGDSRVYGFDGHQSLLRLTQDHSYVQDLLNKGQITEEEAFVHTRRNMVTSALGMDEEYLKIDVTGPHELHPEQVLLAFSDGVHDALTDEQMLPLLQKGGPHLAQELAEAALNAGGSDNITACMLSLNTRYATRT